MKKYKIVAFVLTVLFLFSAFVFYKTAVYASGELDQIEDYKITVNPNSDGTLNMEYSFKWKVLSNSEGPLTWVKIGVANSYFNIISCSTNATASKYNNDYVRLDLKTRTMPAILLISISRFYRNILQA